MCSNNSEVRIALGWVSCQPIPWGRLILVLWWHIRCKEHWKRWHLVQANYIEVNKYKEIRENHVLCLARRVRVSVAFFYPPGHLPGFMIFIFVIFVSKKLISGSFLCHLSSACAVLNWITACWALQDFETSPHPQPLFWPTFFPAPFESVSAVKRVIPFRSRCNLSVSPLLPWQLWYHFTLPSAQT